MPDTELVPPAVSDAEIRAAYDEISRLHRTATLDYAIASGRVIVERFFGGDLAAWRQRGPADASLRKLAALLDDNVTPGLTAAGLHRAVEFYDLELRVGISGRRQLTATHVRAVIGLPPDRQESLLGRAEARDWTAERLEREAAKLRKPTRPGRPRNPAFVNTLNQMRRLAVSDEAFADLTSAADLDDEEAEVLEAALAAIRTRCDMMGAVLQARRGPAAG